MAFSDEGIKAKLASLNETQDSISTVSQWIMFHRRQADRSAQIWLQRIKETTVTKKLSLIYLANEIVQQSKIRKRDEFLQAWDPIIVEATTAAYRGSSSDVQGKIRRVVEVWRQRQVFRSSVQDQIEASLNEADRTRSTKKAALGGSLFGGSTVPQELQSVTPLATALQKAEGTGKTAITSANQEFDKITNPNYRIPSAPVHSHNLATLVKKLATAEDAVAESIKARKSLIAGLEKLLADNKLKLSREVDQKSDFNARKVAVEGRARQVDDAILRGTSAEEQYAISSAPLPVSGGARPAIAPPERPDIEELTPPPMESFTPIGSPVREAELNPLPDDVFGQPIENPNDQISIPAPPGASAISPDQTSIAPLAPGADILSSLIHSRPDDNGQNGVSGYGTGTFKKRKMSRSAAEDEFAAFAGDGELDGIDANVGDMI
ncbi:RNA polymerase II-binding domain-containing protein [Dendryphion nanum]|uniref:RNA polymerase II-binding domain-containing protein n=1 Tax=Dendryphion nanum TaxID=256645 RepID=A0A9P9DBD2_9PLEO|nr:RNA polymerase II-binding domain-containing protein [Dendryphion nanum]